ncbi:MAG: energy transducer TonB [Candidatus Omnitrophota bacterium]
MYENKSLQLAVLISIFLHFTIFLSAPYMGVLHEKQPLNPIKVAYFKIEEHPEKLIDEKPEKLVVQKQESPYHQALPPMLPEALPEVRKEDIINPPHVKKEEPTVETVGSGSDSRAVIGGKGKKFETVVNDEKDSGKKATYIGYYRLVREKIRYYADKNYIKEGSVSEGEVFLSFVVTSKGELLHIMIIDRRSADDSLLRNIAIDSVKDASPFPAFPQGMNQYQITFNVVISFELNR